MDDICLGFRARGAEHRLVADEEEMGGWAALQDALHARFGIQHPEWYVQVVQPPFAPNLNVLWTPDEHPSGAVDRAPLSLNLPQAGA